MTRNMDDLAHDIVSDLMEIHEGADALTIVDVEEVIIDIVHKIQDDPEVLNHIVMELKMRRFDGNRCPKCGQGLEVEEVDAETVECWGTPTTRKEFYKHCDCGYKQW